MAQVINTNALSLTAQNNLNKSQSMLGDAIERLSSGLRINSAKDDAAGQAIANRFTANVRGLTQAARNANDGISIAQTTEGALNEINNNLQRIRELTVQAQNGTNSKSDLTSIQAEITQRLDEIDRVSAQTQFNGVNVLAKDNNLAIQVGANDGQRIDIKLSEVTRKTLNLSNLDVRNKENQLGKEITVSDVIQIGGKHNLSLGAAADAAAGKPASPTAVDLEEYTVGDAKKGTADIKYAVHGSDGSYYAATIDDKGKATWKIADKLDAGKFTKADAIYKNGEEITTEISASSMLKDSDFVAGDKLYVLTDAKGNPSQNYVLQHTDVDGTVSYKKVEITAGTGDTSATTKITETTDSKSSDKTLSGAAVFKLGDVMTISTPLADIDKALAKVDDNRSQLGAIQNRFTSAIANLNNTVNNLSSARSRIEDADYATEVSNMTRAQILQQAGTAVLAQANQVPQNVLSLLR